MAQGVIVRAATAKAGTCSPISVEEAVSLVKAGDRTLWVDIKATDVEEARVILEEQMEFHRLAVEDALSGFERPTLQEFDRYLFFAIPAIFETAHIEDHIEVGFFLTKNALVTVAAGDCPVLDLWFDRWCTQPKSFGSAAMLMHEVLDGLVDAYFPLVDRLEDELDTLSEAVFEGDTTKVKDILVLKRRILECRRRIAPVRDIVNGLLRRDISLIPERTKPFFQDVFDHVIRVTELLDVNRETLTSLLDVHLSQVSTNLNLVVKKMTVVATVLMLMTLISSIYGMNFKRMPELEWAGGYGFALGLMAAVAIGAIVVFRRIKWL